jgi:hypothetical protein
MLATFAFDICHEVYRAAREVLDNKIATLNMESSGKYVWHPDRLPQLTEYVADFARAGERALEGRGIRTAAVVRVSPSHTMLRTSASQTSLRTGPSHTPRRASPSHTALRASRMAMFRVFYLGGAEYHAARRHMGISELTWADWADEIRTRVGRELLRARMFPPSKYFLESFVGQESAQAKPCGAAELRA